MTARRSPPVANNLTTLSNVKEWLGLTGSASDDQLNRLISSASRFILNYLQRSSLFRHICNEVFDGVGQRWQMLKDYPVLSISSLTVGNQGIQASPSAIQSGYVLDPWDGVPPGRPQRIGLRGFSFGSAAMDGISVQYVAGFGITGEADTIPSASPYTVTVLAPNGPWGQDDGVTYASGQALAPVATNPAAGQYSVLEGTYTFAAADAGKQVLISYSYVPADIEQVCCELVGERFKYRNRIGEVSKSLNSQETVSYSQKDMPDTLTTMLQSYQRVLPL
jgi:hypothetical protein